MNDCIFCKIVGGEIPSAKIYETDKTLSFLDIGPTSLGHTLVIPKDHYETILEIPENILSEMLSVVKKIGEALQKTELAEGFNLSMNNGRIAGQEIPHAHFHIIPRKAGDGLKAWPKVQYGEGELGRVQEKIISNL